MTETLRKREATKQKTITETLRRVGNIAGTPGPAGPPGADGAPGVGVPPGGTTGQVNAKASNADYDTEWVAQAGGGGYEAGYWAPLTNGDPVAPELIFNGLTGETIAVWVPTP